MVQEGKAAVLALQIEGPLKVTLFLEFQLSHHYLLLRDYPSQFRIHPVQLQMNTQQ